jgi:hypothetical protein
MAVSQTLDAGVWLSARTASTTSTPMATTPPAEIATACGDRRKLAACTPASSPSDVDGSTIPVV